MRLSTSLVRALDVLTLLAGSEDGLSTAEVVDALNEPRSNVVRIVNTLIQHGLIARGGGRRLRPTQAFYDLCSRDRYGVLRRRYRPVLASLAQEVNELVLLGLQEGNAIIHIDYIESDHRIRVAPSPVTRHDLRRNAIGKVALARRPDLMAEIDDPNVHAEIARVRRTGIGWNREETTEGVIVMACPGFTNVPTEPIIAVAWPVNRFSEEAASAAHRAIQAALRKHGGKTER
jgi:DNA-binding IclR family transcriptional regulator